MIAGGCTVSPPIISLCIQAGWSMGGVKERYLKYKSAGGQYVGHCACGLNPLSADFAISPLYFDFSDLNDTIEELEKRKAIENWLDSKLTNFENITPDTLHLIHIAFASICFHQNFLLQNLY